MGKINLKKPYQECGKGCKGVIVDKDGGIYCKHIERKLPKSKPIRAWFMGSDVERVKDRSERKPLNVNLIVAGLKDRGFEEWEIDLIVEKALKDKALIDIKNEDNWKSMNEISYRWHQLLKKLKRKARDLF